MFKYHLALEAMIQTSIMYSHNVGCVTLFLHGIFNFIRCSNYATYDITVHNISNLQHNRYIPHKSADTKRLIVHYIRTVLECVLIVVICYKLSNHKDTHYAQW